MGTFTMNRLSATATVCVTIIAGVSAFPHPIAQGPPAGGVGGLPIPREGQYGADNYFQYINVPGPNTFEWGYRRGNPKHNREEYLSQKDHTFKAKLKWHDDYGGHGEHYFDYNHGGGYKEPAHHAPAYSPPKPSYAGSEQSEQFVDAPAQLRI